MTLTGRCGVRPSGDVHIAYRVFGRRPATLENANLGWAGQSGVTGDPLASHEEGSPRDTAITREQLNAKDNCLAWLVRRRSMLRIGGPT
jgi:hypothetical protein